MSVETEREDEILAAVASLANEHPSIAIGNLRNKRAQIKIRMCGVATELWLPLSLVVAHLDVCPCHL